MGAKPKDTDIVSGFVDPGFGPRRGKFWEEDPFQYYFVSRINNPSDFYVIITEYLK
jgi:hypothetical protein